MFNLADLLRTLSYVDERGRVGKKLFLSIVCVAVFFILLYVILHGSLRSSKYLSAVVSVANVDPNPGNLPVHPRLAGTFASP